MEASQALVPSSALIHGDTQVVNAWNLFDKFFKYFNVKFFMIR